MWLPLCSNAHDDVTDLEICEYHKNINAKYFENETFFSSNKKIQGYYMAKNSWCFFVCILIGSNSNTTAQPCMDVMHSTDHSFQ